MQYLFIIISIIKMKINRPKSYSRYNNNASQNNLSKTSTGFFKLENNKNLRLFSGNLYQFRPKLFSLLDINDKITNSRGTSLPMQFKRLTDEDNQRQFGFSYRKDQNFNLALIKKFLSKMNFSNSNKKKRKIIKIEETNKNDIINEKKVEKNSNKNFKIKIENNNKIDTQNENKNINNTEIVNKNNIRKIISNKQKQNTTELNQSKLKLRNRNDCWLPEGYPKYELLVNNPKLLLKQIKNDPFAGKLPDYNLKIISKKSYDSDIFFKKPITKKESSYNKKVKQHDHQASDIFNLNYDVENLLKSSEKYIFKTKPKEYYYLTRESNSKWSPKLSIPTFLNSPSTEYNILNPGKKNIGMTKEKIIIEVDNQRKKNIEEKKFNKTISKSVNYMNPIYRQKGLSEFIDITRNGGNNTGKDFINCYNNNPKCFCKNNEVCSSFYNSYAFYRDICTKPFTLDTSLKYK